MRRSAYIALLVVPWLWSCDDEPRLEAESLFTLHKSTVEMKRELKLSKRDAAALEGAIDVLVGDATRELVAATEASGASPSPAAEAEAEARILAPVDGLTFHEVVTAAAYSTERVLQGLLAELSEQEAVAAEHQKHLDQIHVVRAGYGMSLATRRSWIDLTVHNGSDRKINELLLDCKLVEHAISMTREQGTCSAAFPDGLAPGASGIAQSYVGWESEPRSSRTVEARAIRAYGDHRAVLWEVPSELNPLEAGLIGDIKSRVAVIDSSLRTLKGVVLPAAN
jgi:hypothetical protein